MNSVRGIVTALNFQKEYILIVAHAIILLFCFTWKQNVGLKKSLNNSLSILEENDNLKYVF